MWEWGKRHRTCCRSIQECLWIRCLSKARRYAEQQSARNRRRVGRRYERREAIAIANDARLFEAPARPKPGRTGRSVRIRDGSPAARAERTQRRWQRSKKILLPASLRALAPLDMAGHGRGQGRKTR